MKQLFSRRVLPLLLFVGTLITAGCAQDVPDIDRTQPRAIDKSIFRTTNEDGTLRRWFFRQTIVEVPFGTGVTFVGEQTEVENIVWEIQERFLYAYRAHEYVENAEKGQQRPSTGGFRGAAVAAFAIESHFDIQRSYNAATGEQTNVIVENTTDRPWYERKHMRVDFSRNQIADFRFVTATVKQQAVGYYVPETEQNNKDRAQISEGYIDLVQKVFVEPELDPEIAYYYGESYPVCWLFSSMTHDCLGQTLKIRLSFLPIANSTYVADHYDNRRMDKFGYFRSNRYAYDRRYGITENGTKLYSNRWNIWEDPGKCVSSGNTPYSNCTVRRIPIHLNDQFPENLKDAAARVMAQWNGVFREMVQRLSGKDQGNIFVFCPNNPIKTGDPEICGKEGLSPQIGDLRYNFLYWVDEPHRAPPLGYGPSAINPLTGEIVSANAFVYGAEVDHYANYATDVVRVLNGDLKSDDLIEARHLAAYYSNIQRTRQANRFVWKGSMVKKLARMPRVEKKRLAYKDMARRGRLNRDWVSGNLRRFEDAKVTGIEEIIKGEVFKAFGLHLLSPSGQATPEVHKRFGMPVLANRSFYSWHRKRRLKLSQRNIMMADFIDDSILARALQLKKDHATGGKVDYDKVRESLRADIFISVALHEVGHILGLRHNFGGSADALNYHDEYWKLRAQTVPPGATTPLPQYRYDAKSISLLDDAIRKGMREYQYSSIMDYGASFASDLRGLGKYDRAAIMYGYGGLVETFKPGLTSITRAQASNYFFPGEYHYTQIPQLIAGANKSINEQIKAINKEGRQLVFESELAKNTALIEVPYRFCTDEYHGSSSGCYAFDAGADPYERVMQQINSYWFYYIFDAFKRGRLVFGMDVGSYLSTIYDRYFTAIADQHKHFVNLFYFTGMGFSCGGDDWYIDPKCGESGLIASITALNFFARVLQTPDTGCFRRSNNNTATYSKFDDRACSKEGVVGQFDYFTVAPGVGRGMISQFDYTKYGFEFAWKPTSIGAWWDKYLAVMALGDPYTSFAGVDTEANFNNYMINFNTMFGRYVTNIVGPFIAGRTDLYSAMIDDKRQLIYRDPIRLIGLPDVFDSAPDYSNAGRPINPNEQYTAQFMAGYLASAYFSADTNDQYFNETMKISVRGLSESPEVSAEIRNDPDQYVEVTDPGSHRIYYAAKTNNLEGAFSPEPAYFSLGYEYLKQIKDKYFEADGKTLKSGVERYQLEGEFHFINVMIGWVHASQYNPPE